MVRPKVAAPVTDAQLTAHLSALGYPGFSHYKPATGRKNPVDVILSGLNADQSLWTVFARFILPVGTVGGTYRLPLYLRPANWFIAPGDGMEALFYIFSAVCTVIFILLGWKLKRVSVDEQNKRLYVSNYRKEIAIPFSEISRVTVSMLSDPHPIVQELQNLAKG